MRQTINSNTRYLNANPTTGTSPDGDGADGAAEQQQGESRGPGDQTGGTAS
ncbi:MAG: hypothetical protein HZC02_02830 [Candidatus Levybacteria bacterium]|nr:hypothetical protein [Candidatus Levybacteria bacterium]